MSNRFNGYMLVHFKGHQLMHKFEDTHRGRTVRVFDVGAPDVMGVSDGVDSWMTPKSGMIGGVLCERMRPINDDEEGVPTRAIKNKIAPSGADDTTPLPIRRIKRRPLAV